MNIIIIFIVNNPTPPSPPPTITSHHSGAGLAGMSKEKLEELRQLRRAQKRKSVFNLGGEDQRLDKAFLEMDRRILAKLRAEETPVRNRSTVLSKANAVRIIFICILMNRYK